MEIGLLIVRDLFYSAKFRSIAIQLITLIATISLIGLFVYNAAKNLNTLGIASGFDFLWETSGFSINQLPIQYSESSTYFRAFLVGLINTIIVSVLGIICSTFLGFWIAIFRLSSNYLLKKLAVIYVESLRNIPLLLLIFFCYYVVLGTLPHARESLSLADAIFINNRGMYIPALIHLPGSKAVTIIGLIMLLGCYGVKRFLYKYQMNTGIRYPLWPAVIISITLFICAVLLFSVPYTIEIS